MDETVLLEATVCVPEVLPPTPVVIVEKLEFLLADPMPPILLFHLGERLLGLSGLP